MATKTKGRETPQTEAAKIEELTAQRERVIETAEALGSELATIQDQSDAALQEEGRLLEEALKQGRPLKSTKKVADLQQKESELTRQIAAAERVRYRTDLELTELLLAENAEERTSVGAEVRAVSDRMAALESELHEARNKAAFLRDREFALRKQERNLLRHIAETDPSFYEARERIRITENQGGEPTPEQRAVMNAALGEDAGFVRVTEEQERRLRQSDDRSHQVRFGPPIPLRDVGEGEGEG